MYNGIEISHPVYATLFCNMIVTFLSSIIDVFVFPFVTNLKYSTLVSGNSVFCLLFHFSNWFVLSVLRYFYIVYPDQLHNKFPEQNMLSYLAIVLVFLVFAPPCILIVAVLTYCGWPQVKVYHMPLINTIICTVSVVSNYLLLLSSSCCFYFLILWKRGKLEADQGPML